MKLIIFITTIFALSLGAQVKTASGKEISAENLGVANIKVW